MTILIQDVWGFSLSSRKNDFNEWKVMVYKNGKRYPEADYFSPDYEDAANTFREMKKKMGVV